MFLLFNEDKFLLDWFHFDTLKGFSKQNKQPFHVIAVAHFLDEVRPFLDFDYLKVLLGGDSAMDFHAIRRDDLAKCDYLSGIEYRHECYQPGAVSRYMYDEERGFHRVWTKGVAVLMDFGRKKLYAGVGDVCMNADTHRLQMFLFNVQRARTTKIPMLIHSVKSYADPAHFSSILQAAFEGLILNSQSYPYEIQDLHRIALSLNNDLGQICENEMFWVRFNNRTNSIDFLRTGVYVSVERLYQSYEYWKMIVNGQDTRVHSLQEWMSLVVIDREPFIEQPPMDFSLLHRGDPHQFPWGPSTGTFDPTYRISSGLPQGAGEYGPIYLFRIVMRGVVCKLLTYDQNKTTNDIVNDVNQMPGVPQLFQLIHKRTQRVLPMPQRFLDLAVQLGTPYHENHYGPTLTLWECQFELRESLIVTEW